MIATIGEALEAGWRLRIYCRDGKRDHGKSTRECRSSLAADLETLVWTRGQTFPITSLETRMKCPRCGSRRVSIAFEVPPGGAQARA